MTGKILIKRRRFDDTLVPKGFRHMTVMGETYVTTQEHSLRRWNWYTKLMDFVTCGWWPWGKSVSISAWREDRLEARD